MNNNFMLQKFIQNGNNTSTQSKVKKSSRMNIQQTQLQVGTVYNQICHLLESQNFDLSISKQISKTSDKLNILKEIVIALLQKNKPSQRIDQSNVITCPDCQNYENSLQKLENQVRQHIRVCQQLKLYQDTQQEKLQQNKKEKKEFQRKIQHLKKQFQEVKTNLILGKEKIAKLEGQNEQLSKQLKETKRGVNTQQDIPTTKRQSHKQSASTYETKQNKVDWGHRNISVRKEDKEKQNERRSIDKKNESAEKNWRMSANAKSAKMISGINERLVQEKTKEERRKVIQSKFDNRR